MVDIDSVLLSVQERDKWRRRLEVLERSLGEVRERRRRLELRLARMKKELVRLRVSAEAIVTIARDRTSIEVNRGSPSHTIRY